MNFSALNALLLVAAGVAALPRGPIGALGPALVVLPPASTVANNVAAASPVVTTTDASAASSPVVTTTDASAATSSPVVTTTDASAAATATGSGVAAGSRQKMVFAHFMVGIVADYTAADWTADITAAHDAGIDAFALNIGNDDYTATQLGLAYAAAANTGFKLFVSIDFAHFTPSEPTLMDIAAGHVKKYLGEPAQLVVDGKPFVSSFLGGDVDFADLEKRIGTEVLMVPNLQPSEATAQPSGQAAVGVSSQANAIKPAVGGLFSWDAWQSKDNKPVAGDKTTDTDEAYVAVTGKDKVYMAPISPWFFTHYGTDSYNKNYLFQSDTLWVDRWNQLLKMSDKIDYIEIIAWTDYGESSYVTPNLKPPQDAPWAVDFNHTGFLTLAQPFIKAFKTGKKTPVVEEDGVVFWYRPHKKDVTCAADKLPKPDGAEFVRDELFAAAMTKNGGEITLQSGDDKTKAVKIQVQPGIQVVSTPLNPGTQSAGLTQMSAGTIKVTADCPGMWNFNAAVVEAK